MKAIKETVALAIWLAAYVPTTVLVMLVLLNVVLKNRSQVQNAPDFAR